MSQDKRHHYIDTIEQVLEQAIQQKIIQLTCDDRPIDGAHIGIDGQELLNFGSCSYLALEQDPRLIEAVVAAVRRFGTQFSSSRAYLSVGLYKELEAKLGQIFQQPVVVTPTTSLGHQASFPVLVRDQDAVILDHQVHASVQNAVQLLKPRGIPVHLIRHNRLDQLEALIQQLKPHHQHIWYMADGVYSMFGDLVPLPELQAMLERHEQLHLYLDDAHGMSWTGPRGCGYVRCQLEPHPRVVLAVSLNKAFAAAGGALVFPNEEMARKVRTCGPTLIFSGPVQPPMLGAALASAKIHLSDDINPMQQRLQELMIFTRDCLKAHHLPLVADDLTPIFFVATGLPRVAFNLVHKLYQDGFYLNTGTFPATPMQRGGVRFTLTLNHHPDQILRLVERMAYHYPQVLWEEGIDPADVEKAFGPSCDLSKLLGRRRRGGLRTVKAQLGLQLQSFDRIDQLDRREWDRLMKGRALMSSEFLGLMEKAFLNGEKPEDRWQFRYVIVRDSNGTAVLATVLTSARMKDDLFAPEEVSAKIEQKRKTDPYWLTSDVIMAGTGCGEGNPLYIRYQHPQWQEALSLLSEELRHWGDELKVSMLLLRDFDSQDDAKLADSLLNLGFSRITLPDRYRVEAMDWQDEAGYLARMKSRYRYSLRKEILAFRDLFDVFYDKPKDPAMRQRCFDLYHEVQQHGRTISTFPLPKVLLDSFFDHPQCDVLRLHFKGQPEPVAVMYSFHKDDVFSACFVGLDYRYVESHKTYKQMLFRTLEHAHALGYRRLDLSFTAGLEKRKIGAVAVPTCGYALVRDQFNLDIIESMVVPETRSGSHAA